MEEVYNNLILSICAQTSCKPDYNKKCEKIYIRSHYVTYPVCR